MITIGEILTTQGHKGEVKVRPYTDFPQRFQKGERVLLEKEGRLAEYEIASVRHHKRWVIIGFAGIADMSAAEKLAGYLIKIPPDQVYPLPEGHYYVFQLVGLPVYSLEGRYLGDLQNVLPTGGNDVYQIVHPQTGQEILVPAIKECVAAINLEEKRITVKLLPGLAD
ncbi:MAG: 16S rRNA processing protein RimM [Clostridia bacterium]|nr:16S rRNA processing protein RimM [Clostridia bacterium]